MAAPGAARLRADQVRYLAFEGGGGKGFAFVGALQALEALELLRFATAPSPAGTPAAWMPPGVPQGRRLRADGPIKGISGASAGAITALLLSCGYSARDILAILLAFDFDSFFEPARPRVRPRIQVDRRSQDYSGVEAVEPYGGGGETSDDPHLRALLVRLLGQEPAGAPRAGAGKRLFLLALDAVRSVLLARAGERPPAAVRALLDGLPDYLEALGPDMGIFPGWAPRKFFAELIAHKLPNGHNATFAEHRAYFVLELAVTGTNLAAGKSGVFSASTTPNFPVADAVRISMGLPLAYKPVVIRPEHYPRGHLPDWVDGVWVDGGYLNNLPLHVFDLEPGANPKTLGLRLELDPPARHLDSLGDLLTVWPLQFGLMGPGEAYVSPALRNHGQTINLSTEGLSLLEFSPPPAVVSSVSRRGFATVLDYFGAEAVEFEPYEATINELLAPLGT